MRSEVIWSEHVDCLNDSLTHIKSSEKNIQAFSNKKSLSHARFIEYFAILVFRVHHTKIRRRYINVVIGNAIKTNDSRCLLDKN